MKLCEKAQKIMSEFEDDQRAFQRHGDRYGSARNQSIAMHHQIQGSKRQMVLQVTKHMARCRLCTT